MLRRADRRYFEEGPDDWCGESSGDSGLDVASAGLTLAAELHTVPDAPRGLACFVPVGAVDPQRVRPITSRWERQQLRCLAGVSVDGLTMNFPGIGSSTGQLHDNTLQRRAKWVNDIIDATTARRRGRGALIVIGCSMGGHVAADFTAEHCHLRTTHESVNHRRTRSEASGAYLSSRAFLGSHGPDYV